MNQDQNKIFQNEQEYRVGDFVWFMFDKNEEYPGTIKKIKKSEYSVEICLSRSKSRESELEIVKGKKHQLRPMLSGENLYMKES